MTTQHHEPSTVIIGGGLGGLFTGALLTKEGYHVTVIEKNATIGGGLQTFRREGISFETGMHMLGGLRPDGSINKICHYLGIMDELKLCRTDSDCMDSITYLSDGKTYRIPEGREAFTNYFIKEFPHEEQGIRAYVDALYRLADEVGLFYLRTDDDQLFAHSDQFMWAASELIAHYIAEERLRDLLAYMNPMYGGVEGHTPAYIHALINVLYINGQDRFIGGSQQMADALAKLITEDGGRIVRGDRVTAIHTDDNHLCTAVTTASGNSYSADYYISAIHPAQLVDIADAGAFPKAYRTRVKDLPNTYSAFTVYIKLLSGRFPYINHTCYFQDDYGHVWQHGQYDENDDEWPHGFMYMTPADAEGQSFATKMIINCLMPFSAVERWKDTTVGQRGNDYEQWKQQQAERILRRMEQLHKGFRDCIDCYWTSSPLTIRDYYAQPEGALYGVQKDCKDIIRSQLPIWTKVKNLLLTGQNINLHGICGVPLTAVNTAEALVGRNRLVEKINRWATTLACWATTLVCWALGIGCWLSATSAQAINLKEYLPSETAGQLSYYDPQTSPTTAIIVCPGGSYFWLDTKVEGDSVARSLQQAGIAAYMLRYRTGGIVPFITHSRLLIPGHQYPMALDDVQEAVRQVRKLGKYQRIGVMGFSAGGHLALSAAIFGKGDARPDFVIPCYPVVTMTADCVHKRSRRGLLGEWKKYSKTMRDSLSLERHVTPSMPPVFLMNCKDDPVVDYRNSVLMDSALTANHVPHRYLQYQTGGHGFGTTWSKTTEEASHWFSEFLAWLKHLR